MQSNANFLMEHLQDLLVRATLEHVAVSDEHLDSFLAGGGRLEIEFRALGRRKVAEALMSDYDVLDLVHEDVDASIQTLCDSVIEGSFELLFLAHNCIEEVLLVDVGGLYKDGSVSASIRNYTTDHLLVKVDLDHLLDRVADVDQLEELYQRCHLRPILMVLRSVRSHLRRCLCESGTDVLVAEGL